MQIAYLDILNFRGISAARIYFNGHTVLIGDNNAGKSTIFEAIDLVLGPDRLNRMPVIDEHDFYNGVYYIAGKEIPTVEIEIVVIDLSVDQKRRFSNHLEFWDSTLGTVLGNEDIKKVDDEDVLECLRVKFIGSYDPEDDDFKADTIFCSPVMESGTQAKFTKTDKRECGFLYLRALRTGARALSMERGSLLDIILRIREIRPQMWEEVLKSLRATPVASDPSLGIKDILDGLQMALKEFVPADWGSEPMLKVSDLTREHLRKTLTVFMSTGKNGYHAPFQHQGTGTVNTMVLALLSMIAEAKRNVIFAMEEPEIAIPPYTQKRIVDSIRKKATQSLFTSHSPFILEEFEPANILLVQRNDEGNLAATPVRFPKTIKPKSYNREFRLRFSEALLAKRVLLTEGLTEATAYSAAARRLNELAPATYNSLEAMGVAIFNVESDTAIASYGAYFTSLGKKVFAVYDRQADAKKKLIEKEIAHPFESPYAGFEKLLTEETGTDVLIAFYNMLLTENMWPVNMLLVKAEDPNDVDDVKNALLKYLKKHKGTNDSALLLSSCSTLKEFPQSIRTTLESIRHELEGKEELI